MKILKTKREREKGIKRYIDISPLNEEINFFYMQQIFLSKIFQIMLLNYFTIYLIYSMCRLYYAWCTIGTIVTQKNISIISTINFFFFI